MDRRAFLHAALAAVPAGLASSHPSRAVMGANDRIRVGLIGCGGRGNQVASDWVRHKDSVFAAACDVASGRLSETAAKIGQAQGAALDTCEDYRRILDRKDIDAVFIATPDHWHGPMTVEACAAGKDVYVEKPVSNEIEPALKMVEAARAHDRVVQVGLQQRSWHHFQEAAQLVRDGYPGTLVTHCVMSPPPSGGGRLPPPGAPQAPPADLNWELFQGPAARKPYQQSRQRNWRSYWDYGGGSMTDWGVHLTDVMLWYLGGDAKTPLLTSASAQYIRTTRDPERAPDTYSITWQFDTFVATLSNAVVPGVEGANELYGNYFFFDGAVLHVNRMGYEVRPLPRPATRPGQPPATEPIVSAKKFRESSGMSEIADSRYGSATHRHIRNFLDCMRSRARPLADIAIGFNSTLPCLLAVHAVKQGQTVRWDAEKKLRVTSDE
jgi:predicted dehydrogenase